MLAERRGVGQFFDAVGWVDNMKFSMSILFCVKKMKGGTICSISLARTLNAFSMSVQLLT